MLIRIPPAAEYAEQLLEGKDSFLVSQMEELTEQDYIMLVSLTCESKSNDFYDIEFLPGRVKRGIYDVPNMRIFRRVPKSRKEHSA